MVSRFRFDGANEVEGKRRCTDGRWTFEVRIHYHLVDVQPNSPPRSVDLECYTFLERGGGLTQNGQKIAKDTFGSLAHVNKLVNDAIAAVERQLTD